MKHFRNIAGTTSTALSPMAESAVSPTSVFEDALAPPRTVVWRLHHLMTWLVALALLIVLAPLMLLICCAIVIDSRGPILFSQPRFGLDAKPFDCLKFRTMHHDLQDLSGGQQTANDDPRVTRVGYFLRRSSMDELPQLINVLRGEMALIGPRAHPCGMRVEGKLCEELVAEYHRRHAVLPGITGWAQFNGSRGAVKDAASLQRRVELDCHYIRNWSLRLNALIAWKTIETVLGGNDAF
jgi:lipopolysaccharide/colanic/teichoic acid biosynthesis glycosyltransferase